MVQSDFRGKKNWDGRISDEGEEGGEIVRDWALP